MGIQRNRIKIENAKEQTFKLVMVCERWCHLSVELCIFLNVLSVPMCLCVYCYYAKLQLALFCISIGNNCTCFCSLSLSLSSQTCMQRNYFDLWNQQKSFYTHLPSISKLVVEMREIYGMCIVLSVVCCVQCYTQSSNKYQ